MPRARSGFASLTDALGSRAAWTPGRTAYVFLAEGEEEQDRLTYAALNERARAIAAALAGTCAPGDRALLLYPPGLDFVAAFFGCLYAGVIAVPAYPPRSPRMMPRLLAILADARPAVALAPAAALQRVRGWLARTPEAAALPWLATDEIPPAPAGREPEAPDGDAVAFLQYTSGSTSTPKGVMVSHANLAHNQRVIQAACGHSEESVFVTWLPVYHDLGLIGNLLQATWVGAPCVLMSPVAFLQSPIRWLRAVSRYRGTTSGGPNFAYDLCARKVLSAERAGLDLSSWQVAFNGAEPVREETLGRFAEAFAVSGFRSGALYPCYGLAEATLMVSGGQPGQEPVVRELEGRRLVGCGRILLDLSAAVVDPESGTPCPPGGAGEIWVAGGSVARGYWNRPEETAHAFGAFLPDGRGPFLRTGDLGVLSGGELFIAGRMKDLIILRGRNHYPQDLEATAGSCHPALAGGTGAAFAVDSEGEERLVLVHEIERHASAPEEIAAAVRQAIAGEHEAVVHEVVLVPPGGVPRTTSGKVQRRACRDLYLQGELRAVSRSRLSTAEAAEPEAALPGSEDWLRRTFAAAARIDPAAVDPGRPLSAYGLDSLAAIEWKHAVEAATGVPLPIAELLEGMTLAEAARRVADGTESVRDEPAEPEGAETGEQPLSWGQRSLWFLDRLAPESSAYVIAGAARLLAGADAETLRRALQGLVDRHPMLRATYASVSGEPVLRVAGRGEAGFVHLDASSVHAEEVRRRLHEEAFRPFDLASGPLLRAALLEREDERLLVLSVHHIAADFWSMGVLARELGALCRGEEPPRPERLYTGFARAQERRLAGLRGERLWEHWRERLAGAPPLDLPTDRPRPPVQTFRGGSRTARLGAERAAAVRALAAAHASTPFVVLLAAFQALLGRWSGQEDFVVGSPTSGRTGSGLDSVVGYFVNPVALRAGLSGDPAGGELLARTRATVIDALEHQDFPFALLAERLQPERDPSRPPLAQAMLTFQKAPSTELAALGAFAAGEPGARLDLDGLILESVPLESPAAQLDLSLMVAETGSGLALALQWNADLFDAATAGRMLAAFDRLLAGMAEAPERRVGEIEILSEAERRQLLAEQSGLVARRPAGLLLHELVEAQAARTPEAPAVVADEITITYRELAERAHGLARHLAAMGVGPDSRVGVSAERSTEMVVALLGTLEAGGAYIPLDPEYPAERVAAMVEDARPTVVLTRERIAALSSSGSAEPLRRPVPDSALAYLLFTSGSTGRPKGVMIEHRSLVNHMLWMQEELPLGPGDRVLQKTPFGFDASVWEFWAPLMAGATLVMARPGEHRDPGALVRAVRERGITILQVVPSLLSALIEEGLGDCPSLRRVFVGGEALTADLVERFSRAAGAELVDLYGPTETTVEVAAGPCEPGRPVRLGPAIHNARVLVLDRGLGLNPVGAPGEICIGGVPVGRGYFERPAETAERFVPDPFAQGPGARLYRTGDLGRRRPDGIEFLGRIDHLVKVRGVRIELGEIEATLARHPQVEQAVVLVREGARLAAFIVGSADPNALRAFLRERLPEAMVPLDWVSLPELPRTPNGKIDRKALALVEPAVPAEESFVAPRTPAEELLAGIFEEVLGVERVGLRDDFFALGGHSLLATRVVARAREPFGIELPLASLFAHPTLAALAEEVERVRRTGGAPPASLVKPALRPEEIPLSFAQESLWFLDRLAPGLPVYNLPAALRLRGPLDLPALTSALEEIVRRHEALRTVFRAAEERPHQVVLPPAPFPLARVDTVESEVWRLAAAEAVRPFALARGPLARALLLRGSPQEHLLVLTLHHTVADGWSRSLFLRELGALYASGAAGLPSLLPELPVQYADYAIWQRHRLEGEALAKPLAWWREELAGAPPALDLPTDRPRRAVQTFRGSSHPILLPVGLVADLRGLARRHGATLFMTLLAGFAALLQRYSGEEDITIGSPVANRPQPVLEPLIGFFVNSLPLRARLAGDPGTAELLTRLRATTLGAYEHQDLPFDRLVEELQPRRDLSRNPLFQVLLAFEEGLAEAPALPGLDAELVPLGTGTAKLDLTLALAVTGGDLAGEVEISTDLFDAATAWRLAGHFATLLHGLVEDPLRPVSRLPLLTEAERQTLVRQGRGSEAPRGGEACLHDLFAAQAARTPDAVAVESQEESLTYRELRRRSLELAGHLQALGVGPEVTVGLCAERTPALVVGLLGILTSGGAYLPLDPELPRERRRALLADVAAPFVIADASRLAELAGSEALALPLDRGGTTAPPGKWRPPATSPDNLAYLLYTSGSTGRPKAVAVPHRGVVNRLAAAVKAFGIGPGDAMPLRSSISFDVSLWEIFAPLCAGARLVLPPPGDHRDIAALRRLAVERGVTLLDFAPAVLEAFLDAQALPIPSLRGIFVGGEALPSSLAARCAAVLGCAPVNMYGPTEASIDVLWHTWRPGDAARATVPLGRPIAGCSVLVLDRDLSPTPVGVPGELWLGGTCLARGYLGRPDLTAERFLPDPEAAEPGGARLYRTGDLARRLPDGEIEFLGRVDHQVKIRGVRIEPAEIEAALRAAGDVREAAVVAVGAGSGRRLAAYLVPTDPAAPPDPRSLRAALTAVLPEALVPSSFTLLAELPRTAGGKLDRRALPEPELPPGGGDAGGEPRTPLEELVAGVWAHLFERERVGRDDDFWELGGHSLLAARAAARLGQALRVDLPVRMLFERPTVASLAAALEAAAKIPAPPLVPRPGAVPPPLSHAQERLWFLDRLEPGNPAYNVPLALCLRGPVSAAGLADALAALARRHEALRSTFPESAGRPAQVIFSEARFPLTQVDLTALPPAARPAEAARRADEEARRPFDLAAGPLCRAVLLRLTREEHLFLLNVHHIVFDGWSAGVLLRELELFSAAAAAGQPMLLPPLPVQYADFALWQREWLDGGALATQLAFWRERLAGAPAALDLPADRRRPAVQSFRGGAEPVTLPTELVRDLRILGRGRGATLFMIVLAGWSALLHRSSDAPEVLVGTPVANRRRPELEGLIGLFVNTLPLRVDLADDPSFADLLDRVRKASLAAYENQDVPFERLVETVGTGRDLSRSPLFQVMLALADGAPPALRLPGVTAEEVPLHNGTAKLELLLALAGAEDGLAGGLEYNADLFDAATARRLADRLLRLLAGAAAVPQLRVGDLPLLTTAEERQILGDWNATETPFPRDLGLHELFEAQAARAPQATALIHGARRVSYGELDAWADRLARRLISLEVGPEVLIGVFCGRTPGMVAAALAVLKAGGAYLPLDPAYPADRLAFLLTDAGAPVVLVEEGLAAALPPFAGTLVPVDLDSGRLERGERSRGFLHPEQAAYAIYTSGSTGAPKGVLIRHGSAVARITWALSAYPRELLSGVLAATSLCFDLSVFEIFVPLAAGGAVVLADDALALPDLPAASVVTLVNTVPSAMTELVRAGALPRSVRVVNLAGEPLRRDLAARIYAQEGVEEVYNLYGPSEDTTYSTGARVERADEREPAIGRPLPNTRVYLLDPGLRPVPVGAPGELWLGGAGVARGYLRRPDLTADRFRPDPFGPSTGGRLYRTGDLARRRTDGTIDYLGRLDHQVKVRGFRIEPGEIEAALLTHPEVREVAVLALPDGESRRLVACVAPATVPVADLRRHLAARLPGFMVPAAFLSLPELPLTPNGKVDRRALERLAPGAVQEGRGEYVAPRNPVEEILASLWAEVLEADRVGALDDFFALGGHSLTGVRLVFRVRELFGVSLPVRDLFLAPTLAGMAEILAAEMAALAGGDLLVTALPADKLRRLMVRLSERQGTALAIPRAPRGGPLPLSFAQERLWFLERLGSGGAAYHIPAAVRLRGPLDAAALEQTLGALVQRHEALRATFGEQDGRPVQTVHREARLAMPRVDLCALADAGREGELARISRQEASRPFDLACGPLLRAVLVRLGPGDHLLALTFHHIVVDGWSLGVLVREVAALYPGFAAGSPAALPELSLQPADCAVWERERLRGEVLENELAFWRERLAGLPSLELPADRPRRATPSWRGALAALDLPGEPARALAALAHRERATPFMALLALFQIMLLRYTGQTDFGVGTPVANRTRSEVEGLIGLFVNTLVLRADLSGEGGFAELLRRVREVTLAAFAHEDLPFEKLVEELRPEREPGRNPFFQVLFTLQNQPWPRLRMGPLDLEVNEVDTDTARADLTLIWREREGGLAATLEYSTDLFERASAERLLGHLAELLRGALADPERGIRELPLLTEAERRQILGPWSGSAAAYPREATIHELFEERAARVGDQVAVEAGGTRLTYAELAARSNRLAHLLLGLGVGPDDRVGLAVERPADLVTGMLGILKAGGAYVPLDLSYPQERLDWMAEDAGLVALVHDGGWRGSSAAPTVCLGDPAALAGESPFAPRTGTTSDNLALVLYTSGSTGRPKGVSLPHRAVVRLLVGTDYLRIEPSDRVAQTSNPSFDAATFEIWGALLAGARLVGLPREEVLSPQTLALRVAESGITVLFLTTALFNQMARQAPGAFQGVHHLLFGGEAVDPGAVRSVLSQGPPQRLLHLYGPTETTTFATWHPVAEPPAQGVTVPIGRPIANSTAYVVDPAFELAPPGVPGELLLGGEGLARGYQGRGELTAERFVPHPWSDRAGDRLYRTGDRVRRVGGDGAIEFLGRIDQQVKIRGFRIEPGEVEAALAAHPGIAECVVVVHGETSEDRRLAAWFAPRKGAAPAPAELRAWLAARLPAYMVPAAFAPLAALPLTPNGKVDRRALVGLQPPSADTRSAEPETPLERLVAAVWSDLLGQRKIGRDDDFFALGGHSLLATRVVSRLREELGVELPLLAVFENPTLAGFAVSVERAETAADDGPVPAGGHGPAPLSFSQERLWFLTQLRPDGAAYNVPAAVRLTGVLDPAVLAAGFSEIVRRHASLRTTFPAAAGEPRQQVAAPDAVRLPLVDLATLPEETREREARSRAAAEAARPFDLAAGPLFRATLLRLGADEHLLLLTLHHIVADGWSMGILVRETAVLYEAFAAGRPSPLPELPVQYADFALWQRRRLVGDTLEREIHFWSGRLRGAPPELALPTDRPRSVLTSERGASRRLRLPAEAAEGVRALARSAGATPFMVFLAAFETLLSRLSGQTDLTVGTPVAGRQRAEIEELIGFFVNTLVLRADLADSPSFAELLARTRGHALDAFTHQELPFEKLVEHLQPGRNLGHTPLFQAFFVLQNAPAEPLRLPELVVELVPLKSAAAKFDLTLTLMEEGDGFVGALSFSTDLLDESTIERWAGHFEHLLAAALRAPAERVSELPLVAEEELRQLLAAWSPPGRLPEPPPLLERIEAWADRTPLAAAVVGEDETLTWRELDERANRLARRLSALAGPGAPVAICLDRSASLVTALLAVLKAGSAYVPLDPDLPAGRRADLLSDCGAAALITTEALGGLFPAAGPPRLAPEATGSPERLQRTVQPEDLAYVIYTSGSTGRPKGVMVEHRQLAAYVDGLLQRTGLPDGARYATVSTFAADLGHTAVFASLATGGALHIPSRDRLTDPDRLAAYLESHPVDLLKIVPSHLAALLGAERPERMLPRRLLVLGGEAAPWSLLERVRELAPGCRVLNHYGPTETTVGVLTFSTWEESGRQATTVPLGRPMPGARAVLVDARLRPVPVGLPGELLIGGPQVSRGYLGRPDLTAERFVPDPLGSFGERLYRTGDRVRNLPGGTFEFLGRIDRQVKIRGFRVEPGEVETALRSCPELGGAVVEARPFPSGELCLVAWVVPAEGAPADLAPALRASLRQRLPEALVPAVFVPLPDLPLTPNGKVDRRALPEPPAEEARGGGGPPHTPAEELVAAIYAELLGVPRVGRGEGFFDLGGHSLLAMRLVSRLRRDFGTTVDIRAVFESPTVAALAARIEDALRDGQSIPTPPLTAQPSPAGGAPLSFAQERLWFLAQLDPGSAAYNVPRAFRLQGGLCPEALAGALAEILRRHESLRTVFPSSAGGPVQRVEPPNRQPLPRVDLSGLPEPVREEEARRWIRREARRPFDLQRGPVLRTFLVRLDAGEHLLFLDIHHIATDAWSAGVLLRELGELYTALRTGLPSPLPDLPLQYADFAVWQRSWLTGEPLERLLAPWRRRLAGAPPALELPTDRPRPVVPASRGSLVPCRLPGPMAAGLRDLARHEKVTLFMILLAAFEELLHRYSGQEDLVVGTPIAGRSRPELEGLIGLFLNSLALRGDLSGDPPFCELLGRAREVTLEAYAFQDLPFEHLVEELQPVRDLARSPLFQTLLVLQNAPRGPVELPGVRLCPLPVDSGTAKLDLLLSLAEDRGGLEGELEYDTGLFDSTTAERLLGHFATLLAGAAAEPGRRLSELPMLSAAEEHQVRIAWNDTAADLPGACLHHLFTAQAARAPEAVALVWGTERWTYRELRRRSGRLALHLRHLGVGPEVTVAVCLDRGLDLVAALLGVLEAGGAYVPLDPAYPRERLAFMLQDSRAAVLLGSEERITDLPSSLPAVALDRGWPGGEGEPDDSPLLQDPGHLAYVIYTSGSTGSPKGVAIEHRSAAALLAWARETFSPEERAGVLAATSVCFDLSVFELFVPLTTGGTVILAGSALELPRLPAAGEVTLLNTVPSAVAELVREGALPPSVRTVNLAGEALKGRLVRMIYERSAAGRVWNLYGPSEDTTYSTAAFIPQGLAGEPGIGRPLPGTRAHVLDASRRELPLGAPGELCLAGSGLARGYLGRPDLTADRFIPDPFGSSAGDGRRLYRTGDLVRHRPDGTLDFLGRIDHQVKVRGFRIELGEIEAALEAHPAIREAVAAVCEDRGESRLAAWVVPEEGRSLHGDDLRQHLLSRLPEPLVPSFWVALDRLPRTPNGKVDRKALPDPEAAPQTGYDPPRNEIEETLAVLWSEVLGATRVGIHDSFFDLGGHSILGVRLLSRVRDILGVELSVRTLFRQPTVAGMAVAIGEALVEGLGDGDLDSLWTELGDAEPAQAREGQNG